MTVARINWWAEVLIAHLSLTVERGNRHIITSPSCWHSQGARMFRGFVSSMVPFLVAAICLCTRCARSGGKLARSLSAAVYFCDISFVECESHDDCAEGKYCANMLKSTKVDIAGTGSCLGDEMCCMGVDAFDGECPRQAECGECFTYPAGLTAVCAFRSCRVTAARLCRGRLAVQRMSCKMSSRCVW